MPATVNHWSPMRIRGGGPGSLTAEMPRLRAAWKPSTVTGYRLVAALRKVPWRMVPRRTASSEGSAARAASPPVS